jgi:MFS family permease
VGAARESKGQAAEAGGERSQPAAARSPGLLGWLREGTPAARRALLAASLGWALDSFDVMLYALVLTSLLADMSISTATAGLLGSVTLVASGIGGVLFGTIADRVGRRPAMILSILVYSVFTAACGFAQDIWQLGVFRFLLGLGMGGEWTSGAAIVS